MSGNLYGGTLTLDGTWQQLDEEKAGLKFLTVRNDAGNSRLTLGKGPTDATGFLLSGGFKEYRGVCPADIWVNGTSGQTVYWDGQP